MITCWFRCPIRSAKILTDISGVYHATPTLKLPFGLFWFLVYYVFPKLDGFFECGKSCFVGPNQLFDLPDAPLVLGYLM